jgi:NAD(P)-dependent dehydrogenase (short-subunit alcohol dehydrogenase family)
MHPLLQRSEAPRAAFISSGVVPRPRAFWGPYQASKMGLEGVVLAWAEENEKMALRVNLFDPGATRTGMRAEAMPSEDPKTLPTPEEIAMKLAPLLSGDETRTGQRITFSG